jgi:hypothetical protein
MIDEPSTLELLSKSDAENIRLRIRVAELEREALMAANRSPMIDEREIDALARKQFAELRRMRWAAIFAGCASLALAALTLAHLIIRW